MTITYEIEERCVIPNWRDYKRTLQLGELGSSNKSFSTLELNINRSIHDWKNIKNIGTAADLINSSFVSGIVNQDVKDAIDYVNSDKEKSSSSLLDLGNILNGQNSNTNNILNHSLLEIDINTVEEFQAFINNKFLHKLIHRTKKLTREELMNPIIWVELSRLYSIKGNEKKSEKSMLTALHLAPNNRFVLRSASRLFIHIGNYEKALYYLKKSENIKSDPWLISAHIATSSLMGRFSPFVKDGKELIKSNNFSNFDLTELSSSLGTLEFSNGSLKKAKIFFEKSMLSPNDNSLAQLEWISKEDHRFQINPFIFNQVNNPFEAKALDSFTKGHWKNALDNSIKWLLDMPFSKRPALLSSYIASSIIKDKNAAIILCQAGLQANPNDPSLLNNIIYSIITSENFDNSSILDSLINKFFNIDIKSLPDETKITHLATLGLIAFKSNNTEMGIKYYKNAIENATVLRKDYLKKIAIINLTNELIVSNHIEKSLYIKIVKSMIVKENEKDLKVLRDNLIERMKTQPNK